MIGATSMPRLPLALLPLALGATGLLACQAAETSTAASAAGAVVLGERLVFGGPVDEPDDLSAVLVVGHRLLVASDETAILQWLAPEAGGGAYRVQGEPLGPFGAGEEVDFEALALAGERVFALGSHARVRPNPEQGLTVAENRERLLTVRRYPARDRLYRLQLDAAGRLAAPPEWIDLRARIRADPLLAPFGEVPSKENGVDFEAVAADGDTLWVGCRSPVLRSGHVAVLVLSFARPERHELRFVDLDGRGIAELVRIEEGLLVLAARERGDAALYLWDGTEDVPGRGGPAAHVLRLGELPAPDGGRAEGLALLGRDGGRLELLVVYDGAPRGAPRRVRVTLPAPAAMRHDAPRQWGGPAPQGGPLGPHREGATAPGTTRAGRAPGERPERARGARGPRKRGPRANGRSRDNAAFRGPGTTRPGRPPHSLCSPDDAGVI